MRKLIILSSVILLVTININAGFIRKPMSENSNSISIVNLAMIEEEEALELECWMIDDEVWKSNELEQEESLKLESWMIDDEYWE